MIALFVEYYDSQLTNQIWKEKEEAIRDSHRAICEAIGFLLYEDDEELKLTISHGEGNVIDVLVIPSNCVIRKAFIHECTYRGREVPDNPDMKADGI